MPAKKPSPLRIQVYHKRLRGGRMNISADTTSERTRGLRQSAVETLMERGDWETIERLRAGELHISDVQRAVREGDWASLAAPAPEPEPELVEVEEAGVVELGAVLADFLQRIKATREPRTHAQYEAMGNVLLARFGAACDMERVPIAQAQQFLGEEQPSNDGKVWAPRTQSLYATFASQVWEEAKLHEQEAAELAGRAARLTRNPWQRRRSGRRGLDLPKRRATRHAFLQAGEWLTLSRHVEGTSRYALYALACLAGLRKQEAIYLRPGIDVDLEGRVIQVQPRKGDYAWRTKTDRSVREVPIGDELLDILREHERRGYSGSRYVLHPSTGDRPYSLSTVGVLTKMDLTAVGMRYGRDKGDSLTYHSFRHTFASWMAQEDASLILIAELMGDTVETVTQFYAHLMPSNRRKGIAIIDRVVKEART